MNGTSRQWIPEALLGPAALCGSFLSAAAADRPYTIVDTGQTKCYPKRRDGLSGAGFPACKQ